MFSRISQLGKNFTEELEAVVNRPNAGTSGNGNPQHKESASMTSAFQTLKSNAKLLNSDTPEPGALEVVFDSNQETPAKSEKNEGSDSDSKKEKSDTKEVVDPSKSEPEKGASLAADSKAGTETMALSKDITSKLRKFKKYEEKYPGMCGSSPHAKLR
jgi:hypothetical protein